VGVGEIDGVGEVVGVGVGEGVGEIDGVGEVVGVGVGEGDGLTIATPLFQTNFLPLFTQVNFLPKCDLVVANFAQADPAFGGVADRDGADDTKRDATRNRGIESRSFIERECEPLIAWGRRPLACRSLEVAL